MRETRFDYGCACVTTATKHHCYLKHMPGHETCAGIEACLGYDRPAYLSLLDATDKCDKTDRPVEFTIDRQTAKVLDVRPCAMSWEALRRSLKATSRLGIVGGSDAA